MQRNSGYVELALKFLSLGCKHALISEGISINYHIFQHLCQLEIMPALQYQSFVHLRASGNRSFYSSQ